MKKIFSLDGAKETLSNFKSARKANKKSKKNIDELTIFKAKKNYKERTGREMTESQLRSELQGGILSKDTREYQKDKKKIKKDYYKKYDF